MENNYSHSTPAVFVQIQDIGYGIPGIQIFCNSLKHPDCRRELAIALQTGGRLVSGTYWEEYYRKSKIIKSK